MEAITASNYRSALVYFFDKVTNDHEPVMVTRGDKQKAAVVLSKGGLRISSGMSISN